MELVSGGSVINGATPSSLHRVVIDIETSLMYFSVNVSSVANVRSEIELQGRKVCDKLGVVCTV